MIHLTANRYSGGYNSCSTARKGAMHQAPDRFCKITSPLTPCYPSHKIQPYTNLKTTPTLDFRQHFPIRFHNPARKISWRECRSHSQCYMNYLQQLALINLKCEVTPTSWNLKHATFTNSEIGSVDDHLDTASENEECHLHLPGRFRVLNRPWGEVHDTGSKER